MRNRIIPPDAETIRTFDGFRKLRNSFFNAEFYFLLLAGRQGLAKSREFEELCQPRRGRDGVEFSLARYIKGNITPVEEYQLAWSANKYCQGTKQSRPRALSRILII